MMHIAIILFKLKTYSIYKALLLLHIAIDIDIGIKFASFISMGSLKIAIACREERISPVFDVSNTICLVEIDGGKELRRWNMTLLNNDPFARAREISSIGTKVLICGAVSRVLQIALAAAGVQVVGFICGNFEDVLSAYLRGQLTNGSFSMPGCFVQQQRLRLRQRRGKR